MSHELELRSAPVVCDIDFNKELTLSSDEVTNFILKLEELAKESPETLDIPVEHHFSDAVYAREMKMPAGALVIGKIHKKENLNILSQGEVSVLSIDGLKRIKAPHTFVGSIGAKRVIYAHTDVVWTTIHGTSEKDIEKIESEFIAKDYEEINKIKNQNINELGESLCHG